MKNEILRSTMGFPTMFRCLVNYNSLRPIGKIVLLSQSRRVHRLVTNLSLSCRPHFQASSPIIDCHRSRNFPDPRVIPSARKMSNVPLEFRKFVRKFQEGKLEEDGLSKAFINKDLSYGEFNKFGRLNPWCVLDYFEASLNLFNPDFEVEEHVSLFARNIEMNFKKGLEGRIQPDVALKFKACMTYLGKSSVCWETQCLDLNTGEELGNYLIQMVTVNLKERKPAPLAHLLKIYCPENLRDKPPSGFDLEFKPESAFKHEFGVNWSDTDFNSHLNQADITRMCIDCGSFAARQNSLSAFSRELVAYDMKRCSVMFMKEARPGEKVLIECWESEDNPLVLNFVLSKENEMITVVQMEYFSGDASTTSKM